MTTTATPKGEWVRCGRCGGHGVVAVYSGFDFEGPADCDCNGGALWRYPSGVLARYPGGPFAGRDDRAAMGAKLAGGTP